MKVYVDDKQIILVGKAWEIRQKLREYSHQFEYVQQWTAAITKSIDLYKLPQKM
ncbi:Z-ring formation inhibitor MciZ [Priestia megaterium]|nr:Z-ring formation inhibitor MciZ [Priestia megaterium]